MSHQKQGPVSKVSGGNAGKALRVYIPSDVAKELALEKGDHIRWAVIQEDSKKVAKFRKVRLVVTDE